MSSAGFGKALRAIKVAHTRSTGACANGLCLLAAGGFAIVMLGGCTRPGCDDVEVRRVLAPGGKYEAVLRSTNCGATTSYDHRVYVVSAGSKPGGDDEVMHATNIVDLEVNWESEALLRIEYKKARIRRFTNFWHEVQADGAARQIDIVERQK